MGPRVGRRLPRSNRLPVWLIRQSRGDADPLDLDDPDHVGEVQHPAYRRTAAAQRQVVTGVAGTPGRDCEHAQGGEVDGGDVREVDDDVVVVALELVVDRLADLL